MEIEGTSLQVDTQEKGTDIVLKVAAVECSFTRRERSETGEEFWKAYLESDKLFSSRSSTLPSDVSLVVNQSTSPTSSPLLHPSPTSPKHRSFILLDARLPRSQAYRPPTVQLNVQPFEVVLWLPVVNTIKTVLVTLVASRPEEEVGYSSPYLCRILMIDSSF